MRGRFGPAAVGGAVAIVVALVLGGCSTAGQADKARGAVLASSVSPSVVPAPQAGARRPAVVHGWAASLATGMPVDLPETPAAAEIT